MTCTLLNVDTRFLVRSEALLTQLLYDHALRLRMKDSTEEDETPVSEIIPDIIVEAVEDGHVGASSSETTEVGSATSSNKAVHAKTNVAKADAEATKTNGQGLAGRINVLISSDIER